MPGKAWTGATAQMASSRYFTGLQQTDTQTSRLGELSSFAILSQAYTYIQYRQVLLQKHQEVPSKYPLVGECLSNCVTLYDGILYSNENKRAGAAHNVHHSPEQYCKASHRINGNGKQIGEHTEYDPISKFPKICAARLYMAWRYTHECG